MLLVMPAQSQPATDVTAAVGVKPFNHLIQLLLLSDIRVKAAISGQPEGVVSTAEGSISPASQHVALGSTTTFTVTPAAGYLASVTGCGGVLAGSAFTTGPITAPCTVTTTFTINQSPATDPGFKSNVLWIPPAFVAVPLNNSSLVVADTSGTSTWPPVTYIPGCLNGRNAPTYNSGCAASHLYSGLVSGLNEYYTLIMGPTKTLSIRLKASATLSAGIKSIKISAPDGGSNLAGSVSLWLTIDPTISYDAVDTRCKATASSNLYIYTHKDGGNYCPLAANGLYYLNIRANFACSTNCRFKIDGSQDDFL